MAAASERNSSVDKHIDGTSTYYPANAYIDNERCSYTVSYSCVAHCNIPIRTRKKLCSLVFFRSFQSGKVFNLYHSLFIASLHNPPIIWSARKFLQILSSSIIFTGRITGVYLRTRYFTDLNSTNFKIGVHVVLRELAGIFCLDSIDLIFCCLFQYYSI